MERVCGLVGHRVENLGNVSAVGRSIEKISPRDSVSENVSFRSFKNAALAKRERERELYLYYFIRGKRLE